MRTKEYLKTWWWTAILMYLLYDVVWILADYEEFRLLWEEGGTILWVDFCYCLLFSLYNLCFGTLILKSHFLQLFKHKKIVVFCVIFLLANTALAFLIENLIDVLFVDISDREAWGNAYLMGLISTIQALIVAVEYYYRESEQKYKENRQLELQLLKMQMNPQFMFNSLSVLASLISIDAKRAESYVVRLSRIYRHILGHIESDVVSLEEAFQWLDDYVALLQLRYAHIELVVEPMERNSRDNILSQSLQVLIENAVKHNAPSQTEKLTITISRQENMLVVSNNLITPAHGIKKSIPSHKLGLDNLAKRYLIKFGQEIKIENHADTFTVYLPIIQQA